MNQTAPASDSTLSATGGRPSGPSWPGWLWVLALATSGGGGLAGVYVARDWIVEHPLESVALALAIAIVVYVGTRLWRIWRPSEDFLIGRAADAIKFRLDCLVSGHPRRYLEHLVHRHRDFDVKGLSTQGQFALELARVFVELRVEPTDLGKASRDLLWRHAALAGGANDIWSFLSARQRFDRLVILGPPGSGKTTLLKHVALVLAHRGRAPKRHRTTHHLPILITLRDVARSLTDSGPRLAEAARDSARLLENRCPPLDWFQRCLDRHECLVLLDGFDEVADVGLRRRVAQWIEARMAGHAGNRFVVTSRPHGYRASPLSNVTVLEVQPFTAEQVRRFVGNWYLANEIMAHAGKEDEGVRLAARTGAEDLLARLYQGPGSMLAELAVNPLLLTMVATVHRFRSSLPGRRVELFAEIAEVFLGKRKQAAGIEDPFTPAQRQLVLEPLAHAMMVQGQREIATTEAVKIVNPILQWIAWRNGAEAFLRDIEARSGLVLERESGRYAFAHLSFQEYLAASHIAGSKDRRLAAAMPARIAETWWHETLRLFAAQGDCSAIVDACLAAASPACLVLAFEIAEEAKELRPGLRERVRAVVDEGLESTDPERFRLAAETALARRLNRFRRIDDSRAIDPTLVTHAEYQLFIDERAAGHEFRQPDHWTTLRFAAGTARSPVLGVRGSDASEFCDWLTTRTGGLARYRLPTSAETAEIPYRDDNAGQPVRHWAIGADGKTAALSAPVPVGEWLRLGLQSTSRSRRVLIQSVEKPATAGSGGALPFDPRIAEAVAPNLQRLLQHPDLAAILERELSEDRALALARDRDRALARALDLDFTLDLDLDLDLDRALDLARALDLVLDRARARALDRALDLLLIFQGIFRTRLMMYLNESGGSSKIMSSEKIDFLHRWSIIVAIYFACLIDIDTNSAIPRPWTNWLGRRFRRTAPTGGPNAFDDAARALWILRERMQGRLTPFEGIRLVRERAA